MLCCLVLVALLAPQVLGNSLRISNCDDTESLVQLVDLRLQPSFPSFEADEQLQVVSSWNISRNVSGFSVHWTIERDIFFGIYTRIACRIIDKNSPNCIYADGRGVIKKYFGQRFIDQMQPGVVHVRHSFQFPPVINYIRSILEGSTRASFKAIETATNVTVLCLKAEMDYNPFGSD